jgi:hypothetical protein
MVWNHVQWQEFDATVFSVEHGTQQEQRHEMQKVLQANTARQNPTQSKATDRVALQGPIQPPASAGALSCRPKPGHGSQHSRFGRAKTLKAELLKMGCDHVQEPVLILPRVCNCNEKHNQRTLPNCSISATKPSRAPRCALLHAVKSTSSQLLSPAHRGKQSKVACLSIEWALVGQLGPEYCMVSLAHHGATTQCGHLKLEQTRTEVNCAAPLPAWTRSTVS